MSVNLWINVVVCIYSVRILKTHAGMQSQQCVNVSMYLYFWICRHCLCSTQHSGLFLKRSSLTACTVWVCVSISFLWLCGRHCVVAVCSPLGGVTVTPPIIALMHFPSVSHHDQETGKHRQRKESASKESMFTHTLLRNIKWWLS